MKNSCWYRNFTRPGVTRELTHELSSSDRFGEFRQFFRMPLSKVEMLTDTLIQRGFVPTPRTKFRQAEFRERTELLVMSAIYILANGAAFRSCRTLCGICTSVVRKFFYRFLDAIVEMKRRNPRYGCPRIAQQINLAFGLDLDKDTVRRVLEVHYKLDPAKTRAVMPHNPRSCKG